MIKVKYDLYQKFISGMSALDKSVLLNTVVNISAEGCALFSFKKP